MRADWVSPWWQAVLLPDRWDVCGFTVPSLSVWHVFALENIGNGYILKGDPDIDDAASLLLYARTDMAGGRRLMLAEYHRARSMRRVFRRLRRQKWDDVHAACSEYVAVCMRHGTRMSQPGSTPTPAGAPEPWAIVATLCRLGESYADAWNTPYAVGRAMMDASDEAGGKAVMTPAYYGEEMVDHWPDYENMTGTRNVALN